MLSFYETLLRMVTAAALGGAIGYERDRHGRPVGLRTHMIVALSAATFMIVSSEFAFYQHFQGAHDIEVDASRIAASVVSAIGFLAGGSILRTGTTVQGLTTAAGLWLVTAIGLSAGAGMYFESLTATALGMLTLTLVRRFEDKDDRMRKLRLSLRMREDVESGATRVLEVIAALRGITTEIEYDRHFQGDQPTTLTIDISVPREVTSRQLMAALENQPGLERVHIQNLN